MAKRVKEMGCKEMQFDWAISTLDSLVLHMQKDSSLKKEMTKVEEAKIEVKMS